jgi:hypothetical protein
MGLGDHRIAGSDGGGKIPAHDRVEGEGKVVRAKHRHRATQRTAHGADVIFRIDAGVAERALARGSGRLA